MIFHRVKMWRYLAFLVISSGFTSGQVNWVTRGRVPDPSGYFSRVVQELVYDLEKLEWCNLKLNDHTQVINQQLYQWHVNGTAYYTNGFIVSIQALDVTNFMQNVFSRTVDGVAVPHATVSARLNLHHPRHGFDVLMELNDPEPPHERLQRFTGHYTHAAIVLHLEVTKNLLTNVITSNPYFTSITTPVASTLPRMIYMPANNVTEVLARVYVPSNISSGVTRWTTEIIGPRLVDIATNRVKFPDICLNNCPA